MTSAARLDAIKRERPEWSPWLAVVEKVIQDATDPRWELSVPGGPVSRDAGTPLVAGTTIHVDEAAVRRLFRRLLAAASRTRTPKMATLDPSIGNSTDTGALLRASICQDEATVARVAAETRVDSEALQAVVALLAVPVLQACHQRWTASLQEDWLEGYCPICGSWPAFAETLGIERTRHHRCGRCGSAWHAQVLRCAYCGNMAHEDLRTLVPETPGAAGFVEACGRCRAYEKVFTRLQGCAPASVMLDDLRSVDLDIAALHEEYVRPSTPARQFDVEVVATGVARRFFAWNA